MDTDKDCYIYSDDALNQQINLTNLQLGFEPDETNQSYQSDLTSKQKLRISIETALRILAGTPDTFEYKSPVLGVKRSRFKNDLVMQLNQMLFDSEGGRFAVSVDTDFNALVQAFDRYCASLDTAESAWSGTGEWKN